MQKFFRDTLQSKMIKSIVYRTPIPTFQFVHDGEFIIKGSHYIYKSSVIFCTNTGFINGEAKFDYVSEYTWGNTYPKYTNRYLSTDSFYDIQTHYKLGEYLRGYSESYRINLMPFYNCFGNDFTYGLRIQEGQVINTKSVAMKCALVPVKLNKTYTICLDSTSGFYIAPVFLNAGSLITFGEGDQSQDLTQSICKKQYNSISYFPSSSFNRPLSYSFNLSSMSDTDLKMFKSYETYLYMILQIPATNDSTIVVLEGDYTTSGNTNIFSVEGIEELQYYQLDQLMLSKLTLLQMNIKEQIPYSPRLIEYLLQNVITANDDFWKDIYIVQQKLNFPQVYSKMKGVWEPEIRYALYNKQLKAKRTKKFDINGYVDKDVEQMLNNGWYL